MAEHNSEQMQTGSSFKDTLNLPRTDFPIRANAKIDDPALIKRWQLTHLSRESFDLHQGREKFILHDGPPYANGHIHIGHAYNKILKDMTAKAQRMLGKHVPVTPGWDCHGLPIELKVTQENPELSGAELKKACRAYAQQWVHVQRQEFEQLGVLMDWDRPYLTMSYEYEASILRAFSEFVRAGYIERKNKTVPWCASCQTVLATAEIEYQDRKDPSIYVLFPLEQSATDRVLPALSGKMVNVLIWTTTPWTLPLNRAVLLRPKAEYVVLEINGTYVSVGKPLADALCAQLGVAKVVVAEYAAEDMAIGNAHALHPFIEGLRVPLLLDQSVMLEEGTAFVHCAPGAGPEDYEVGIKNKLAIFSPVAPDGTYTREVEPQELMGMHIKDGQIWVLKKLTELNRLLLKKNITHSYPQCWRCRNGLIFRATKQWFCDLSKHDLKQKTLAKIDTIQTVPDKSINRLKATIEGRLEWCLSRQRVWGVPITAVMCAACDHTYITPELIEKVASAVATQGIEYWDSVSLHELLPADFACPACAHKEFIKEHDILDVWFDSGVSHYAVLKQNSDLAFPAQMYLEGKDQHRGWFQSSLLTSMVLNGVPPMQTIMTHGFTVDSKGHKMSKSLGNVVSPQQMIDQLGTDGLRMWAASIDCSGDAVVSDVLLKNVEQVFRKIRNTCRFLLSNLYDFDSVTDMVDLAQLQMIDQHALCQLFKVNNEVITAYAQYDFTAVFHMLGDYCAVDLSAFYLDIVKDRLYVAAASGHERRSAQTACWYILDTLTRLMAPVLSFTAEQVSDNYQKNKQQSIHLQQFNMLTDVWQQIAHNKVTVGSAVFAYEQPVSSSANIKFPHAQLQSVDAVVLSAQYAQQWELLYALRSALLKAIEQQRATNSIKHSLEAAVRVYVDSAAAYADLLHAFFKELQALGQSPEEFFKEFVIVSDFKFISERGALTESTHKGFYVEVTPATGVKCPRCWQWQQTTNEHGLCARCQKIVQSK
jgi:isoleucyl-tRNA synthetase